jgi:hypothetical protein
MLCPLPSLTRHNHPLQPRLPIIRACAVVEDRDPETRSGVAPLFQMRIKSAAVHPLASTLSDIYERAAFINHIPIVGYPAATCTFRNRLFVCTIHMIILNTTGETGS